MIETLHRISSDGSLWSAVLWWFLQASLLCGAVILLAKLAERWSATLAHRMWIVVLVGIALLPVLSLVLPEMPIPVAISPKAVVQPDSNSDSSGSSDSASLSVSSPEGFADNERAQRAPLKLESELADSAFSSVSASEEQPGDLEETSPHAERTTALAEAGSPTSGTQQESTVEQTDQSSADILPLAIGAWTIVAVALLLKLALSVLGLRRFICGCKPASDCLRETARSLADQLGVRSQCEILVSEQGTMPLACWLGRWYVVVPEGFERWPESLRDVVLTHELGHIARRDSWSDLLAQIVCRLGWPHPLLWLARFRVRHLRERACDEWVLNSGHVSAEQYARSLLDVISHCQSPVPGLASGMARQRDLESRVRTVISRRALAWAHSRAAGLVGGACIFILTSVIAAAQVIEVPAAHQNDSTVAVSSDSSKASSNANDRRDPTVERTLEPIPEDGPKLSVHGVVTGPDRRPASGADVVLRAKIGGTPYGLGLRHNRDVLARTKTNGRGEFRFGKIGIPPRMSRIINQLTRGNGGVELIAWAKGSALAWQDVPALNNSKQIAVKLIKEVTARGIIRGPDGETVAGAKVWIGGITPARELAGNILRNPGEIEFSLSQLVDDFAAQTDDRGRFRLAHLPPDHRMSLIVSTTSFAHKAVVLDTDPHSTMKEFRFGSSLRLPVHTTSTVIRLERQQGVRIKLVNHDGRPIRTGSVSVTGERRFLGEGAVNKDGVAAFSIRGAGKCTATFAADPLEALPSASVEVDVPEDGIGEATIRLPKPRLLTGRVVSSETNKPITGAYVLFSNSKEGIEPGRRIASIGVSQRDGTFRLPVMPGEATLEFRGQVHGYLTPDVANSPERKTAPIPVTIPESGEIPEVELKLSRGMILRGTVMGTDGRPAKRVVVRAENTEHVYLGNATTTDDDGRFELAGLSPHVPTALSVAGKSGAVQKAIPADPERPWDETRVVDLELKLSAGVALFGRIMRDGEPQAGIPMKLWLSLPQEPNRYSVAHEFMTNNKGEYRVAGLRPGMQYRFEIATKDGATAPGWTHQSPYLQRIEPTEQRKEIKLPDAVLIGRGQELSGIVVDPDGNPVAGVSVSARIAGGAILSRPRTGPPPWTKTDKDGRFNLRQLPDKPIELMAYIANPKGGRIRFPAKSLPKRNQRDIRIVYDPTLQDDVEDLDK